MKTPFIVLLCCFCLSLAAQKEVEIFTEKNDSGYTVLARNNAFCPMSVSLDLELENISFSEGKQKVFIVPAKAEKFKIGSLTLVAARKKYSMSFTYHYNYGNILLKAYDADYAYDLPYERTKSFLMFQGYNGRYSHQNENALDFTMPEGTEVLAAREGIVIKLVENNSESCANESCNQYNNYITIYHPDGTFADYVHIKHNGAKVKLGDAVKKGDVIAYSGNTGWSTGPHLHFACYMPSLNDEKTIQTKFRINDGSKIDFLVEGNTYVREY